MVNWNYLIPFLNKILQLIAFLVGACWVIYRFTKFRRLAPKLIASHEVNIIRADDHSVYLKINLIVENIGQVLVNELQGYLSVLDFSNIEEEHIRELKNHKIPKALSLKDISLSDFVYLPEHIEPGERDIAYTIIKLNNPPEVIEVYTLIKNVFYTQRGRLQKSIDLTKTDFGWSHSTIHKITKEKWQKKINEE